MLTALKLLVAEEKGQGLAEYGFILASVAIIVISTLIFLGPAIAAKFTEVKNGF